MVLARLRAPFFSLFTRGDVTDRYIVNTSAARRGLNDAGGDRDRFPSESFQAFSAAFWDLTGFDLDLVVLAEEGFQSCFHCVRNDACRRQLANRSSRKPCKEFLQSLGAEVRETQQSAEGLCHAGYQNMLIPATDTARTDLLLLLGRKRSARRDDLRTAARFLDTILPDLSARIIEKNLSAPGALSPLVRRARDYLESHYHEAVSLKSLSKFCGVSPFHFSHRFSIETGVPFSSYLSALRVRQARRLLRERVSTSVAEICFEVGFQSVSQFNRAFWRETGRSPTAYRREARQGGGQPPDTQDLR